MGVEIILSTRVMNSFELGFRSIYITRKHVRRSCTTPFGGCSVCGYLNKSSRTRHYVLRSALWLSNQNFVICELTIAHINHRKGTDHSMIAPISQREFRSYDDCSDHATTIALGQSQFSQGPCSISSASSLFFLPRSGRRMHLLTSTLFAGT
jgi:hypothetical protein